MTFNLSILVGLNNLYTVRTGLRIEEQLRFFSVSWKNFTKQGIYRSIEVRVFEKSQRDIGLLRQR